VLTTLDEQLITDSESTAKSISSAARRSACTKGKLNDVVFLDMKGSLCLSLESIVTVEKHNFKKDNEHKEKLFAKHVDNKSIVLPLTKRILREVCKIVDKHIAEK
jgi:hypothetical protein